MNLASRGTSRETPDSVLQSVCPTAGRATCSLRTSAIDVVSRRNGSKNSLTGCEVESFLSLSHGHRVTVRDHETGELWRGSVDLTFPEHGFVWVFTNLGERKLLDIAVHTVWRSDTSRACDSDG